MKNNRRRWTYIASRILMKVFDRNTAIFMAALNFASARVTLKIWIAAHISISTEHTHSHHWRSSWPFIKYFPPMSPLLGFFSTFVGDIIILILFFMEVRVFENAGTAWWLIGVIINTWWGLSALCVSQLAAMIVRNIFWFIVHYKLIVMPYRKGNMGLFQNWNMCLKSLKFMALWVIVCGDNRDEK